MAAAHSTQKGWVISGTVLCGECFSAGIRRIRLQQRSVESHRARDKCALKKVAPGNRALLAQLAALSPCTTPAHDAGDLTAAMRPERNDR
jgi:hypothetical protein